MRLPLTACLAAFLLAACGGGGGGGGDAFEDGAHAHAEREAAPLTSDPVYVALRAYLAEIADRDAAGFRDYAALLDARADLARELREAFAAAGALSNLDVFLVAGGELGFGAYDTRGIYDPLGRPGMPDPDTPDNPGAFGSFYFLFGPGPAKDPFDVGLPGRSQEGSPLMPDVAGAIGGVANSGTSYAVRFGAGRMVSTEKTTTARDDVTVRESVWPDPIQEAGQPMSVTETHYGANGHVDRYSVEKYDNESNLVFRQDWTDDGVLHTWRDDGTEEGQSSTEFDVPYEDVAPNELRNPDSAPDMGCLLPWLCDEQTPGETLLIWSKGASRTLPAGPGEDGSIDTHYVAPILTQFDVLSNPGYIDGLIIYDPSSPNPPPRAPTGGPVHE